MKIVLASGYEDVCKLVTIEFLKKKRIEFYVYIEDYDYDSDKYTFKHIPEEDYNTLERHDSIVILPKPFDSWVTKEEIWESELKLDVDKIRFDKDFIKTVEGNETYNLRVEEIPDGARYKLTWGYSGYDDESYEKIEIYKEEEWEIAK